MRVLVLVAATILGTLAAVLVWSDLRYRVGLDLVLGSFAGWAYSRLAVFGLALTGTLYSAYLTSLELAVIHAICPYCVISALLVTLLLVLALIRLRQPVVD